MQKKKQVFTWPISVLVIVVSFLSVLVVLQQVQAAWVDPYYFPSDTSTANNFVFTPLAENLVLGSKSITGTDTGGINITGPVTAGAGSFTSLSVAGVPYIPGGGGGASSADWAINNLNNDLYYTTTTGSGNVGIGTTTPNKLLHLYSTSPNAELDIQSTATAGSHWGIYHDAGTDQLRFWKSAGNDILTLGANGRVSVGTAPDNSNMIRTTTATAGVVGVYGQNSATDISYIGDGTGVNPNNIGVKGVANTAFGGGVGIYGTGFYGVKGVGGAYGLYGEAAVNGTALWAKQGSGNRAALLQGRTEVEGNLLVTGNIQIVGSNNFLYITAGAGAPASSCSIGGAGKIYLDSTNFSLYICSGSTGWKSTPLN